jgi:general stress protein YciG
MSEGKQLRGFAAMDEQRQRDIARQGGRSVPDAKRSFSQNHALAVAAGRTGGRNVPRTKRSFAQDRALAAEAGRKGGERRRQAVPRGGLTDAGSAPSGTLAAGEQHEPDLDGAQKGREN